MAKTNEEMEAMLNDEEEDIEPMVKKLPDWVGQKKDRLTGQYVRVKNGFNIYFKVNLALKPVEILKEFNNDGKPKTKFQWQIYLQKVVPTAIGKGIQVEDPDTYKKVMDQNDHIDEEFIFEVTPTVDQQLAKFLFDTPNPEGVIAMKRTGSGNLTKYHFREG